MFDAFPFDKWDDPEIVEFWTFGGAGSTGTWILTVLGIIVMLVSFVGFIKLENGKLDRQAEKLRASGGLSRPPETSSTHHAS